MRKKICKYCNKVVSEAEHNCTHAKHNRKKYNQYRRDYVERNKETIAPLMTKQWRKLRLDILQRDKHHCQRCLIKYGIINGENLEAHHIKSRLNYPELMFDEHNIVTICRTCNVQLGTKDKLDFEWSLQDEEDFGFKL